MATPMISSQRLIVMFLAIGWLSAGVDAYHRMLQFGSSPGFVGGNDSPTSVEDSPTAAQVAGEGWCAVTGEYWVASNQGGGGCADEGGQPVTEWSECVYAQAVQEEVVNTPYLFNGELHTSLIADPSGATYDVPLTDHGACTLENSVASWSVSTEGCTCEGWTCGVPVNADTCDADCQPHEDCYATEGCTYCVCMQETTGDDTWGLLKGCVLLAGGKGLGGMKPGFSGYSGCNDYTFNAGGTYDAAAPDEQDGDWNFGMAVGWQVCKPADK